MPNIANGCRLNEETVTSALKELVARGMIEKEERQGYTNRYRPQEISYWAPLGKERAPRQPPRGKERVGGLGMNGGHLAEMDGHPPGGTTGHEGIPTRESQEGDPRKAIQADRWAARARFDSAKNCRELLDALKIAPPDQQTVRVDIPDDLALDCLEASWAKYSAAMGRPFDRFKSLLYHTISIGSLPKRIDGILSGRAKRAAKQGRSA